MGKPIYTKTIYIDSLPNSTKKEYSHGITNVENIWFDTQNSLYIHKDGLHGNFTYVDSADKEISYITSVGVISNTSIRIYAGIDRSSLSAYVTVRYTKITDSAS